MATKAERKVMHDQLDGIVEKTRAAKDWPDKHDQLAAAAATVHMLIDDLHDLTPYEPASNAPDPAPKG